MLTVKGSKIVYKLVKLKAVDSAICAVIVTHPYFEFTYFVYDGQWTQLVDSKKASATDKMLNWMRSNSYINCDLINFPNELINKGVK